MINKDSKYKVTVVTTHSTLHVECMRKHLYVYCFLFHLVGREIR